MSSNALISSAKATESSLHAALHPLVLLTISDYITRHTLRKLTQPIVGALIGQLHGREISIEHAYDVKLVQDEGKWQINDEWFSERLQQYKDVHKAPILDLVGWWTVSASIGPTPEILDIHRQVMKHNETALLLTFHPEAILQGTAAGGKLPLTIYETIYENIRSRDGAGDEAMQVEGEETGEKLEPRFKELRHEIATGEAEMISVDFVARGGGNATAVESRVNPHAVNAPNKGKEKATESKADPASTNLNSEEGELISFLTSRANAIKMLLSRISSIRGYLNELPPSYLTTAEPLDTQPELNHPALRAILALVAKLPLVTPPDTEGFAREQASERSDVALVQLLGEMGRSVNDVRTLGYKQATADANKKGDKGQNAMPSLDIDPGLGVDSYEGMFEGGGGML
ncbi:MAG: hypothetical protein MMC23_001371 [Stictis urceolatum]|nr:hypothetical protein [Stictis urceolata]